LLKRESSLHQKENLLEKKEKEFNRKVEKLRAIKESLESLRKEALARLEKIAKLTKTEAKKELLKAVEDDYKIEIAGGKI